MAEPIQRRSLGQQLSEVRLAAPTGRTVDTSYRTQAVEQGADRGAQVLDTVINAAGQGVRFASMKLQQRVEDDKVRQMNQALMGLEPTDDASQAGFVAHGAVGVQNDVLAETKRLEQLAATFTGSDEEWEQEVISSRKAIQDKAFSKYPNLSDVQQRSKFLSVITNSFLEQSPRVAAARISGKLEQQRISRINDFQGYLLNKVEELGDGDVTKALGPLFNEHRQALQLSKQEAEQVLVEAAVNAANRGDTRLIEFTKSYGGDTSLFDRNGKLQQAEKVAGRVFAAENAGAMAIAKDELNSQFYSGALSWPQFAASAEELNRRTGNTAYTDDQLISLKNSRQRDLANKADIGVYMEQANKAALSGGEPVGLTVGDEKTRDALVEAKVAELQLIGQAIIAKSPDLENQPQAVRQLKARMDAELSEWLSSNQLVNKDWKNKFDSILNYNLDNVETSTELPANVNEVLDLWYTLPEGSRVEHASSKTNAMLSAFEDFQAQGHSALQSLHLAQKAVRSTKNYTGRELSDIKSDSDSAAEELTSGSWLPFDSAPGWYTDIIRQRMYDATINNMKAGYTNSAKAAKDAALMFERHHTRLDNGQLLFGSRSSLARQMKVNPADIELTLDTYLEKNSEQLLDRAGGATLDELYFDVVPGRGIAYVRSGVNGMPVSAPIVMSELKVGRDEYLAQREAKRAAQVQQDVKAFSALRVPSAAELAQQSEALEAGRAEYLAETVDAWTGASRINEKVPAAPEMLQEEAAAFETALMQAENSVKAGFNKQAGVWNPHPSLEGGADTLAYGHKLTASEMKKGYVEVDGKAYRFTDGDSEITEQIAQKLMRQDMAAAEKQLRKSWKVYDDLPSKYKQVLINLQFNTGSATPKTWPKLRAAMLAGDDATVRSEMITSYKDRSGDKVILEQRATSIADALGIK